MAFDPVSFTHKTDVLFLLLRHYGLCNLFGIPRAGGFLLARQHLLLFSLSFPFSFFPFFRGLEGLIPI